MVRCRVFPYSNKFCSVDTISPNVIEGTLRRKLKQSSLKDVDPSNWTSTGAIIVRHAFKGLSRDLTVVSSSGFYDASCRNADLKHICFRLNLDLTQQELQFLLDRMDAHGRGFFSSTGLFHVFTQILKI